MVTISVNGLLDTINVNAIAYNERARILRARIKARTQEFAEIKGLIEIGELSPEEAEDQVITLRKDDVTDLEELRKIAANVKRLTEISRTIYESVYGKKEGDDN